MSPVPTITVLYTCDKCGLVDIPVQVPSRSTEEVTVWMNIMGRAVGDDHFHRSPHCRVTSLTNVKIPVTGASQIGGVLEN